MPINNFFGVPVVILSKIKSQTKDIFIHAVEQVSVTHESLVTKNPTETGLNVTDHVVNLPVVINMTGRFVDSPFGTGLDQFNPFANFSTSIASNLGLTEGLSKQSWAALEDLRDSGELFDVIIQQGVYEGLVFKSLSAPRGKGDGTSQRFQAEMHQILTTGVIPFLGGGVSEDVESAASDLTNTGSQGLSFR